jgi:hypothetical protein
MRNIVKIGLTACLVFGLGGCATTDSTSTALYNNSARSNENIMYSQVIETQTNISNLYITIGKDIKVSNEILIKPSNKEMFIIEIILDKSKEIEKLTFNKKIKSCEKGNIDILPLNSTLIENKTVYDAFLKKEKQLKIGSEINFELCKPANTDNIYYLNSKIEKYSFDSFLVQ